MSLAKTKWHVGKQCLAKVNGTDKWLRCEVMRLVGGMFGRPWVRVVERDPVWHGSELSQASAS